MAYVKFSEGRKFIGRVPFQADLLDYLTGFAKDHGIRAGQVMALGAVSEAVVGFYDQHKRTYFNIPYHRHLEILNLTGNISLKDGKSFVHAHVTLSDEDGHAFGGHLMPGTTVFACEFIIHEYLTEQDLNREFDQDTGLGLWKL